MVTKKKKEKGTGQFICGKCDKGFPKAHGLAIHIHRTHKARTWGKSGSKAETKAPETPKPFKALKSVVDMVCIKCGRDTFKNTQSYGAHRRYCKGITPSILSIAKKSPAMVTRRPIPYRIPVSPPPFNALRTPSLSAEPASKQFAPASSNGHNQIDRLKKVASEKRREADEIDKLVASFESSAEKFLSK